MNEGEFSGGPVQSNHEEQGNFASQEPTTPEQSADTANQVMFSSADATASRSGKSVFDNSNSFDRPQGAISSDAGDSNGDEPEHNFSFGGRSRRGGTGRRNFDAEPQNTFTPNPNAPAFFNDAMASMTPVEQPKSNKNFLKIGIIAAVAILVVGGGILVAVLAGRGGGSGGEGGSKKDYEQLAEIRSLISEYKGNVEYCDEILETAKVKGYSFNPSSIRGDDASGEKKALDDNLAKTKEFKEKLDAYKEIKVEDIDNKSKETGSATYLANLKSSLDKKIPVYEKYVAILKALYDIYDSNGSESSINSLAEAYSSNSFTQAISEIRSYYKETAEYRRIGMDNNCNVNYESTICMTNTQNMMNLSDKMQNSTHLADALYEIGSDVKNVDGPISVMNTIQGMHTSEKGDK